MIQKELDYVHLAFASAFGDEAMAQIPDDVLLFGSAGQLLRSLMHSTTSIEWHGLDPILALETLAVETEKPIRLVLDGAKRWTALPDSKELVGKPEPRLILPPFTGYRLLIDADWSRERPLVFEYTQLGEHLDTEKQPIRAQILPKARRVDDGEGDWRVSGRLNSPLQVSDVAGDFGICVVTGLGLSLETIFGDDFDAHCLNDQHIQSLVQHLLEAQQGVKVALLHYSVEFS